MTTNVLPGALRILVVENDPRQRADIVENLKTWPYEYYCAEASTGAEDAHRALLEDAKHKAHAHRCHIALVDMRLRDDSDPSDISGLAIVKQLAPTVSIILSAYGDRKTVREALKSPLDPPARAYDFIGKEDGPEALKQVIQQVETELWHHEGAIQIHWLLQDFKSSQAVVQRFFPNDPCVPSGEADDVLRRLLPEAAQKITLTDLCKSTSTPTMMLRPRSLVVKALVDDNPRSFVVKLMRRERVEKELQGYEYVKKQLMAARFAHRLSDPVELWDMGGVIYSLVGGDDSFELFSEFYKAHGAWEIAPVLNSLKVLWAPLYQASRSETISLVEAYGRVWGKEWYDELIGLQRELESKN